MRLDDIIARTFQANGSTYTILGTCKPWWIRSLNYSEDFKTFALIVLKNERISTYSKYLEFGSLEEWTKTIKWMT